MYSHKHTQALQEQTRLWLMVDKGFPDLKAIEPLRDVLRFHEYRYYVLNEPLIADGEYDRLYKLLEKSEALDPSLITPNSPTQRVAKGLTSTFQTVQHLVPMLSLENSYEATDLLDWDRKARELSGEKTIEYCVEPKFDGASISLLYDQDLFVRGATRGDGVEGEDITVNLRQIRSLPLSAPFSQVGIRQMEIRGEVLMSKAHFRAYNQRLAEQNLPPLANPRNAASGTLRLKDAAEAGKRNLEAFFYHVSFLTLEPGTQTPSRLYTHAESLAWLWEMGFRSPTQEKRVFLGIQAVIDYCLAFEATRDELPYEIDGMVVKVNSVTLQEKLGMTTHHPRWAIAFKFKARQGTSILRQVDFQVGRTGSITPVAKIDPVSIGGVTVSSVSMHNEEFICEKDLRLKDTVLVERAGDVIPYIVKSLAELRTGQEEAILFPSHCPACRTPLVKPAEEAVWRCPSPACPAQVLEGILHFASKDAMDIRGLGEANIRRFHEAGWLTDIPSLYALPYPEMESLEGLGVRSVQNLREAIEKSKQQPLHRLINALGIRYVGETTAKGLARAVPHLLELKDYSIEQLQQIEDVGTKVADSIFRFFHDTNNLQMLEKLEHCGLQLHGQSLPPSDGSLRGKSFLFTGTLQKMKRSAAEAIVEAQGGQLLAGVSSKLNYLVVGEEAGSKLEKARKIPSIHIIDEDTFLQMVGQPG